MTLARTLTERPVDIVDGLNATGVTIVAKRFVTGHEDSILLPAANTTAVYGVSRNDIPDQKRGSLVSLGKAIVTAGVGGVTAGARVMPEAATGKAIAWTSGKSVGGIALVTAIADADTEVLLAGPGSTAE